MNPEENNQNQAPPRPMPQGDVKRHRHIDGSKVLLVVLAILLLVGGGAAYWWRDKQAKDENKRNQQQINELKQKLQEQTTGTDEKTGDETAPAVPTQAMIDNIKAVFATGNTQPLETYMTTQVKVILAASECCGNKSPAEATQEVTSFMQKASAVWNFSIDAATLTKYRAGAYKEYFPNNAVIGKSGDLVISFSFDNAGKINTVFMTNVESVLFDA